MVYKIRIWDDVYLLIVVWLGGNIVSSSVLRLVLLMNLVVRFIYDEICFWGRFFVFELRIVECGYIDYMEDFFNVYGVEIVNVNGLYVCNGINDFRVVYILYDEDLIIELYNFKWRNFIIFWEILDFNDVIIYENIIDLIILLFFGWEIYIFGILFFIRV